MLQAIIILLAILTSLMDGMLKLMVKKLLLKMEKQLCYIL